MRLIKMTGGLGNQMFIYALYIAMRRRYADARIDLSDMMHYRVHNGYEMHRVFGLPRTELVMNQTLKKVLEFLFFKTVLERKQKGSLEPYFGKHLWPLVYYKGFYQNEGYFRDCADEVRRAFTFDERKSNERTRRLLAKLESEECAVSFHVRRGDYMSPAVFATSGCVCGLPYYHNAIARARELFPEAHFYVFSDDMAWAKENLPLPSCGLEHRRGLLAGYAAYEPLPPQRDMQQYFFLVGRVAQSARRQSSPRSRQVVCRYVLFLHCTRGLAESAGGREKAGMMAA